MHPKQRQESSYDRKKEKMLAGMVYEAVLDEDLKEDRLKCKDLCFAANQLPPSKIKEQSEIFASLFAKAGKDFLYYHAVLVRLWI